jgi:ABC-type branched-subunit amino acid transport system substrate-binding protein
MTERMTRRQFTAAMTAGGAAILGFPAVLRAQEPIKIGYLNPSTGVFGAIGKAAQDGVKLALERTRAEGGINGRPLTVVERDTASDPQQALRLARDMTRRENVDVLMGGLGSSECMVLGPFTGEAKVPYMTASGCWATELTGERCNRYTFRHTPNNRQRTEPFAAWCVKHIGKRWFVAYSDFAYGQSGFRDFKQFLEASGGTVVGSVAPPLGATDMAPYISQIDTKADGLFLVFAGNDTLLMLRQLTGFGISKKMRIAANQSLLNRELFPTIPEGADGMVMVAAYPAELSGPLNNPHNTKFHEDLRRVTGRAIPGLNTFEAFQATNLLKEGMRRAGYRGPGDREKLVDALSGLEVKQGPDFPQGDVRIRRADHQGLIQLFIVEVKGGRENVLETIPAAQLDYPPTCKA